MGVVDELEVVEIDHEEGGAGVVFLRLPDRSGEAILKETLVGEAREMVVEGIPLVGGYLLLQQDQEHADGDKEFLQVPDLVGNDIVSGMIRGPGVGEEDERPDHESDNDSDLAETLARQADLKDDSGCEVQDKKKEVGSVAKGAGRGEEPDWDPGTALNEEYPPAPAEFPGPCDGEGADDAKEEATPCDRMVDARITNCQPVDREQRRNRNCVDQQIATHGTAREDIPAGGPEEDRSGYQKEIQCDDVRDQAPSTRRRIRGMNDGFQEDK